MKWQKRFTELAQTVAQWSKDPNRKVGCVLVSPDRSSFGIGYNGLPRNVADSDRRLLDVQTKIAMTVHAELNAILNCKTVVEGWSLYSTSVPCCDCSKAIIQAGISTVYCPEIDQQSKWAESQQLGLNLMAETGIKIVHIETISSFGYDNIGQKINSSGTDYCQCRARTPSYNAAQDKHICLTCLGEIR